MARYCIISIYKVICSQVESAHAAFCGSANMAKRKTRFKGGSVGAYFLRKGQDNKWMTLIHLRSAKVSWSPSTLATPGGSGDLKDGSHW